jgi:leishmanolysin
MVSSVNKLLHRASARAVFLLAAAAGCGGESAGPSEPTLLAFTAGQNQQGQVGTPLPSKMIVRASDARGPVANVTIAVGVDPASGGSVTPNSATTAADGTAQFTWTLGPKVGVHTLIASTTGPTPIHANVSATATPAGATVIVPLTTASQFVVVGHAVPILPGAKATDAFGNAVAGVPVTFESLQAGSVLTGVQSTTDAAGVATLGGWTIGQEALIYSVQASIPIGAVTTFEARGVPASITAAAGMNQTANAGTALPIVPAVLATRDNGSPIPNVVFTFSVSGGGGIVTGTTVTTGADGIARPARWVLGSVAGLNKLDAITFGLPPLTFEATGTAATPALVTPTGGTSLSGFFGNYLIGNPEVTVTDALGNPVAGSGVLFQVTQGGGRVTGVSVPTDFLGRAATTSWRLGSAGAQSVTGTVEGLPPAVFNATGSTPPASTFRLEVRYVSGTSPSVTQRAAFDAAAARWTQLILAGGPPYLVVPTDADPSGDCPSMLNETVDGVVIHVRYQTLSSPNILGSTEVCVIRDQGFLPVQGLMFLNTTALASVETNGWLNDVILHEMGHALGFGTIWDISIPGLGANHLRDGVPGFDPTFNGPAARAAFFGSVAPGTTFTGTPVPLEGAGAGPGTSYSHWRDVTFTTELMTGFISAPGIANPLSAMTVQQFRDLGYVVNDAPTDAFTFQAFVQSFGAPSSLQLVEQPLQGLITVINRQGRVVARVPRPFR